MPHIDRNGAYLVSGSSGSDAAVLDQLDETSLNSLARDYRTGKLGEVFPV
jgi:hypothetical protein